MGIQQDFDAFFENYKPGEKVKVDGLTYTMGTNGRATVRDSTGRTHSFTQAEGPQALANRAASVQQSYNTRYTPTGDYQPYHLQMQKQTANPMIQGGQQQLSSDISGFLRGLPQGQTQEKDGYTYTNLGNNRVRVQTPQGYGRIITQNATPQQIANAVPELAYDWNKAYGTQYRVGASGPTYNQNWAQSMMKQMGAEPGDERYENLDRALMDTYGYSLLSGKGPGYFDPAAMYGGGQPTSGIPGVNFDPTSRFRGIGVDGGNMSPYGGMGGGLMGGMAGPGAMGGGVGGPGGMGGMSGMGGMWGNMGGMGGYGGMPFMTTPLYGGYMPAIYTPNFFGGGAFPGMVSGMGGYGGYGGQQMPQGQQNYMQQHGIGSPNEPFINPWGQYGNQLSNGYPNA